MKLLRTLGLLAGVLLCATVALLWAGNNTVMYTVTPLALAANAKYSAVNALNNNGQAAGWSDTGPQDNIRHAFFYSGGTMTDLGTFGGSSSNAYALNNLGQVVGQAYFADNTSHAFLSSNGGALQDLTPNTDFGAARGINDSGQICGAFDNTGGYWHAFLYSGGTLTDLEPNVTNRRTDASGINSSGQIYGTAFNSSGPTGYGSYGIFYSNGTIANIEPPPQHVSDVFNGMNNLGQVVGELEESNGYYYPALYNGGSGSLVNMNSGGGNATAINDNGQVIGYLVNHSNGQETGFLYSGGNYTYLYAFGVGANGDNRNEPYALNMTGQVGGRAIGTDESFHAFVFSNGAMTQLDTLVNSALGLNFSNVSHINDAGQLIATSTNYVDYLLTPVLSIASSHSGNFAPGQQNATYTLTVTNSASAPPTSGTVAVTEIVPAGLTLVSMSGQGWTCPTNSNTCTRTDALAAGANYSAIAVKVNVGVGVASPQVNRATVSESGVQLGGASDSTAIQALGTSSVTASAATAPYSTSSQNVTLTATVSTSGGPVNGGTVSFTVSGIGTVTSGTVTGGNASAVLTIGSGAQAGSYPIDAVFSGTTGIAGSSDTSKSLTISNAVPVITWPNPADMTAGSALGSGQLDATANVAGSFAYTPPAGAVLPQGANNLSVVFTPNDLTDYSSTSATANVNVVAGPSASSGQPQFVVTRTLSRDGSNNIVVALTVTNTGGQPPGATSLPWIQFAACKLGSTVPLTGPSPSTFTNVGPGTSVHATVTFPGSAGASGATVALSINGNWYEYIGVSETGGSFGYSSRTLLP